MSRPDPPVVPITVVAHPPERGRARSLAPAQAGASCCCCCCCLHSVGAVIGAAIAPVFGRRPYTRPTQEEADYGDFDEFERPARRASGWSAVSVYWLTAAALAALSVVGGGLYTMVANHGDPFTGAIAAGFLLIMGLPALLFAAALVAGVVLAVSSRPDKVYQLVRLGWIALGVVVGTVVGTVPMVCLFYAMK